MGAPKPVRLSGETMVEREIAIKYENFFLRLLLLIHGECYLAAMTSVGTLNKPLQIPNHADCDSFLSLRLRTL
jgi:hypothetical protein